MMHRVTEADRPDPSYGNEASDSDDDLFKNGASNSVEHPTEREADLLYRSDGNEASDTDDDLFGGLPRQKLICWLAGMLRPVCETLLMTPLFAAICPPSDPDHAPTWETWRDRYSDQQHG